MKNMALCLTVLLLTPVITKAGQLEDLQEVYKQCKAKQNYCELVIKEQDELNKKKDEAMKFLEDENKRLRSEKNSILNNPYFYGILGLVVGAVVAR